MRTYTGDSQAFVTTVHPDDGFVVLFILYGAFGLVSLFAPSIVALIGVRASMCLGTGGHIAFVVLSQLPNPFLFYSVSVLCGAGAAIMWNAHSSWMTPVSREPGVQFSGRLNGACTKFFVWNQSKGGSKLRISVFDENVF
jgi:fucose permease